MVIIILYCIFSVSSSQTAYLTMIYCNLVPKCNALLRANQRMQRFILNANVWKEDIMHAKHAPQWQSYSTYLYKLL